ncbi:ASG_G0031360.mRNA.1.CDS.1 [Saccharomyces cerevisiae]|nr:Mst1p [Saccharomyces cerevisiae YJM1463]CAI4570552.1 ASG_G0031360.mRNA.1.CDS.1 [Saccharomyces cerevisiae]CAI4583189.1 BDM_1a_G0032120.mRNA.1.CDS.1 [Saccharomyces cerevisiae]CAI7190937.1 ASG_G0031360.mRNA.1.CDS.1 [Saccharomyces cerevisiae]CAI7199369.1 BDM_1a_G0032120.mRNA.1.CDS.1 [Saccharomyces cerevisiae]
MKTQLVRWHCCRNALWNRAFYSTRKATKNASSATPATMTSMVSQRQDLFMTDPLSPGSMFFLPNGAKIFNKLIEFMKLQQKFKFGFNEVVTPLIYKKTLWEKSGHWENYADDMFKVETTDEEKEEYGLKPMNCPGHCLIFGKKDRSYNELPLRFSDFSPLHRNEASGALSGLTRLRKFHQDDGHIFCTPSQVKSEIFNSLKLIDIVYNKIFPFVKGGSGAESNYFINFSTRPDHFIGDLKVWNHAEQVLKEILEESCKPWKLNPGDGAFYGPKLDIMVTDHLRKTHQVATIQLDFQLPERFDLKFKDQDNSYKRPIMIHRATFGSIERFMALLIDSNEGRWPFWLNPYQAVIIPVNTKNAQQLDMCTALQKKLRNEREADDMEPVPLNDWHFNVDLDIRNEPVGYRIKSAILKNYSYLIIVGDEEVQLQKYNIRERDNRKSFEKLTMSQIWEKFIELEKNYK